MIQGMPFSYSGFRSFPPRPLSPLPAQNNQKYIWCAAPLSNSIILQLVSHSSSSSRGTRISVFFPAAPPEGCCSRRLNHTGRTLFKSGKEDAAFRDRISLHEVLFIHVLNRSTFIEVGSRVARVNGDMRRQQETCASRGLLVICASRGLLVTCAT